MAAVKIQTRRVQSEPGVYERDAADPQASLPSAPKTIVNAHRTSALYTRTYSRSRLEFGIASGFCVSSYRVPCRPSPVARCFRDPDCLLCLNEPPCLAGALPLSHPGRGLEFWKPGPIHPTPGLSIPLQLTIRNPALGVSQYPFSQHHDRAREPAWTTERLAATTPLYTNLY